MGRWGLRRHERQLQMIDNPVHDGMLHDEGDYLHRSPALGADERVGNREPEAQDMGDPKEEFAVFRTATLILILKPIRKSYIL